MWAGPGARSGYPSAEWHPLGGSRPGRLFAVSASASVRRGLGIQVKLGLSPEPALQGQGTRMRRRWWARGSQSPGRGEA